MPHLSGGTDPAILVNLSSSVREPIPGLTASNVLRPGLAGLIKTLSAEYARSASTVSLPDASRPIGSRSSTRGARPRQGRASTRSPAETIDRIPLGRYGDVAEIGRVGAFLLSPAASYVTGAEIVPVDGGMIRALP